MPMSPCSARPSPAFSLSQIVTRRLMLIRRATIRKCGNNRGRLPANRPGKMIGHGRRHVTTSRMPNLERWCQWDGPNQLQWQEPLTDKPMGDHLGQTTSSQKTADIEQKALAFYNRKDYSD